MQVQFKCTSVVPSASEGGTVPQGEPAEEPSFSLLTIPDSHFHAVWPQESYATALSLWLPFCAQKPSIVPAPRTQAPSSGLLVPFLTTKAE